MSLETELLVLEDETYNFEEVSEGFADYVWRHIYTFMDDQARERVRARIRNFRLYSSKDLPDDQDLFKDLARTHRPKDVLLFCLGNEGLISYAVAWAEYNVDKWRRRMLSEGLREEKLREALRDKVLHSLINSMVRRLIEAEEGHQMNTESIANLTAKWLQNCEKRQPIPSTTDATRSSDIINIEVIKQEIQRNSALLMHEVKYQGQLTREAIAPAIHLLREFRAYFNERLKKIHLGRRLSAYDHDEIARNYGQEFERTYLQDLRQPLEIESKVADLKKYLGETTFDPKSYDFLAAADVIESLLPLGSCDHLDYSIAAIGLWKFSENELRQRFCSMLRSAGQMVFRTDVPEKTHRRFVIAENYDRIMLGTIRFAMKNDRQTARKRNWKPEEEYAQFTGNWANKRSRLIKTIEEISRLRNAHAHVEMMTENDFKKLKDLVRTGSDPLVLWIKEL